MWQAQFPTFKRVFNCGERWLRVNTAKKLRWLGVVVFILYLFARYYLIFQHDFIYVRIDRGAYETPYLNEIGSINPAICWALGGHYNQWFMDNSWGASHEWPVCFISSADVCAAAKGSLVRAQYNTNSSHTDIDYNTKEIHDKKVCVDGD